MALGRGPTVISTGVAASDRRTFGQMKNELALSHDPDDTKVLAMAGEAINQAIRRMNRFNWPWEVVSQEITLAAATDLYALDQPFKAPLAAYFLDASGGRRDRRLGYMPYDSFVNLSSNKSDAGTEGATIYTVPNAFEAGQVMIYPRPNGTDYIQLIYYRRTPTGKRDSDPMEFHAEAEGVYYAWAEYFLIRKLGGADQAGRITDARSNARESHAELVAMVCERGDQIGIL